MKKVFIIPILAVILFSCARQNDTNSWTSQVEATLYNASTTTGGRVMKLLVKEGDAVETGDTLAILDTRELQYTMEQLQAGLLELQAQEAIYRTQIGSAEDDLAYVDKRSSRSERLYEAEVISRQSYEDVEISKTKAQNQLKAAQQGLDLLAAKRKSLDAQKKTVQKKLADGIVTSPATGTVETLFFSEGELLPPLGQLTEISDIRYPELSIYVSEAWLPRLKTGMKFNLKAQGYPEKMTAELIRISNKAEFTPKTVLTPDNRSVMVYAVRLRVDNDKGILKDGMPVDISLP